MVKNGCLKQLRSLFALFFFLTPFSMYAQQDTIIPKYKHRYTETALTGGLLKGGGGIIGLDVEVLIKDELAIQFGAGIASFGFGVNLHQEKNNLESNFFSLQYYHQGLSNHVQSFVGSTYQIRAFNFLSASVGVGYRVVRGGAIERLPSLMRDHNFMVLISLGVYAIR